MKVVKYNKQYKSQWNNFVSNAKNSHFFFNREYMEYHKDRFIDFSLMVFDEKDKLLALLPTNIKDSTLYSHQGLTFGGFLFSDKIKAVQVIEIFQKSKEFLLSEGIEEIYYKAIPYIYHKKPCEEDRYALFLQGATLDKIELSSAIYLDKPIKYSNGRKWSIKKAKKENIKIVNSDDFKDFWKLLEYVIENQHGVKPVHNIDEIEKLHNLFPKNIKLYLAYKDDELLSGGVVFVNQDIAHLQYVANSQKGREIGALDLVIDFLIREEYRDKKYFNFGISTEDNGKFLNEGLIDQKERFGASGVVQETFIWKLR